jgi:hypothetical protein
MRKSRKTTAVVTIVVIATLCIGALYIEAQTKIIRRALDDLIYDNKSHYLPCKKLPTEAEVSRIIQERKDLIQLIEQVNPGLAGVEIDTTTCPGKADLVIWYASHQNRLAIETIISGDTFFGVPYRLQNR